MLCSVRLRLVDPIRELREAKTPTALNVIGTMKRLIALMDRVRWLERDKQEHQTWRRSIV